jgi:hypothetical protein
MDVLWLRRIVLWDITIGQSASYFIIVDNEEHDGWVYLDILSFYLFPWPLIN